MSDFEAARPMLFWKTPTNIDRILSPVFRLQNSRWNLGLEIKYIGLTSDGRCAADLNLFLLQESPTITPFVSFEVTCLSKTLEDKVYSVDSKECTPHFADGKKKTPWKKCILHKRVIRHSTWKFVCIFQDENGTGLHVKSVVDDVLTSDLDSLSRDFCSLLESGQVSDVQLKTKGKIQSAHRSVLAARSEVFSAMFRSDMQERTSGQVDITDVDGEIMDLFLRYLYTGKIPDSSDESNTLAELYAVGDKYAVRSLKKLCSDLLTGQVSQDNYQELLVLADEHSDVEFKDKVIEFVVENPDCLDDEKWFEFSEKHLTLANYVYRKFCDKKYFRKT